MKEISERFLIVQSLCGDDEKLLCNLFHQMSVQLQRSHLNHIFFHLSQLRIASFFVNKDNLLLMKDASVAYSHGQLLIYRNTISLKILDGSL